MSQQLYEKALEVAGTWGNRYTFFYRNMPGSVLETILRDQNGIMRTRLKDNSGDQNCVINGKLSGVLFCANVDNDTHEPKEPSPYGDTRILIPANYFLQQNPNLYFADFYCLRQGGPHYVVLVMTPPGSEADIFCRNNNLIQLDLADKASNPFLFELYGQIYVSSRVFVEIFYTEDIDVNEVSSLHGATVKHTGVYNTGMTIGNMPKYPQCQRCNV